jgi:hypothetical protein
MAASRSSLKSQAVLKRAHPIAQDLGFMDRQLKKFLTQFAEQIEFTLTSLSAFRDCRVNITFNASMLDDMDSLKPSIS